MHLSNVDIIYRHTDEGWMMNERRDPNQDHSCPNDGGYNWQYNPGAKCGGGWTDAGKSLTVYCT